MVLLPSMSTRSRRDTRRAGSALDRRQIGLDRLGRDKFLLRCSSRISKSNVLKKRCFYRISRSNTGKKRCLVGVCFIPWRLGALLVSVHMYFTQFLVGICCLLPQGFCFQIVFDMETWHHVGCSQAQEESHCTWSHMIECGTK